MEIVSVLLVRSLDTDMASLLKRASEAGRDTPFLATVTVLMCVYELCILIDSQQKLEDGHFLSMRINKGNYTPWKCAANL